MLRSVLPRFELLLECEQAAAAASLSTQLEREACASVGWVELPYAELHVPRSERHFWSPRLQLTFDEQGAGTRIRAVFRPEPEVWTGFVFAHCLCGVAALLGLSLGLAHWSLGHPPWALLAAAVAAGVSLALYLGALAGHRLGHAQMCSLRRDCEAAFECELGKLALPDQSVPQ